MFRYRRTLFINKCEEEMMGANFTAFKRQWYKLHLKEAVNNRLDFF